ncbi:uncharacterized protein SKDI_04G0060 [Saccharomyces kudriavzevii IFO 1802]|uniref:Uncharacterized protein n=1 Tax=Saccharomyces kudriavzevii (strain ATCC MYA-4449 / AS 2.2408 / CBS 8840 / NBRC 1802 / NCYC 2889) TaxID=226230 RepID=A0AA35NND0_SACK1|nr:uncharacterized protein SKDI_04G0060 [Saccharomyces kudriavzevii IFO 1802]CAI4056983.1 hypothetical protein SKDI_04G0060 [Saccharomyces kudriavzevii IFO 1802]
MKRTGRHALSSTQVCDFLSFIPYCDDFPATFIRASVIKEVLDPEDVQVLYKLDGKDYNGQELIVAAKQNNNTLVKPICSEVVEQSYGFTIGLSKILFKKIPINAT